MSWRKGMELRREKRSICLFSHLSAILLDELEPGVRRDLDAVDASRVALTLRIVGPSYAVAMARQELEPFESPPRLDRPTVCVPLGNDVARQVSNVLLSPTRREKLRIDVDLRVWIDHAAAADVREVLRTGSAQLLAS